MASLTAATVDDAITRLQAWVGPVRRSHGASPLAEEVPVMSRRQANVPHRIRPVAASLVLLLESVAPVAAQPPGVPDQAPVWKGAEVRHELPGKAFVYNAVFSPDSKLLAADGTETDLLTVWDAAT